MLENKIDALTKAVEALTLVLSVAASEMKADAAVIVEAVKEQAADVVSEAPPVTATHDDLRALILSANRADSANKAIIKDVLAGVGAKKVTDVKLDDIEHTINSINALIK